MGRLLVTTLLLVLEGRRGSLVLVAHVRRTSSVLAAHGRAVLSGVLEILVGRRVLKSVEVLASGDEGGVISRSRHVVGRLALNLALDSLPVRSVSDHGKDGTNRLDELSTLGGLGVIQSSLNDVVGERIPK